MHGCAQVCMGVCGCGEVCVGVCRCALLCAWVCACVWDEFSEYLLETRVLTSADFNMYSIQIFSSSSLIIMNKNDVRSSQSYFAYFLKMLCYHSDLKHLPGHLCLLHSSLLISSPRQFCSIITPFMPIVSDFT